MNGQSDNGPASPPPSAPQPPSAPWQPGEEPTPSPRRSGAKAGAILIVIGAALLAAQFIPGVAWWNLWPLIIILVGAIHAVTPGTEGWGVNRFFDGLVTVSFGLVFLAITTGRVGIDVLWALLRLWPVLLIALGFDLLGKALHLSWVRALGSIAIIAVLGWTVVSYDGFSQYSAVTSVEAGQKVSEPVGSVREATLEVDAGLARIDVTDGDDLVSVAGHSPWGPPKLSVERSFKTADVRISTPEASGWMPDAGDSAMAVELSGEVVWDATVSTGVSSVDADLGDVPIRRLELKPGVAECSVRLGDVPQGVDRSSALVESGVSAVTLLVPSGAEARVESDSGLTGHVIKGEFEAMGDRVWETPGYAAAVAAGEPVWDIAVKSGIGSVTIDSY